MPADVYEYAEDAADEFDYESDWKEIIDSGTSPRSGHVSQDAQEETVVGYVAANKLRSALKFFLGWSQGDSGALRLLRYQPHRHPELPWLRAYDCSYSPYIPESNPDNPSREPYNESPFAAAPGQPLGYYARHRWLILSVRYRNHRMRFLPDDDIATAQEEWKRNTVIDTEARLEALQVTGGLSQLVFAETDTGGPPAGTRFGAPFAELLAKTGVSVQWLGVAWEYLTDYEDYFWPTKILECVGTVNSAAVLGDFAAGTMLLRPPRFLVKTFPVAGDDPEKPLRSVDVYLEWEYFEPNKGKAASSYKGHNLMPWSGDGTVAGDGKFYYASRDGTAPGTPLVRETDHRQVFEHVLA